MVRLVKTMSQDELQRRRRSTTKIDLGPYRDILDGLSVGEGALIELEPGETQRVVKRRLTMTAGELGYAARWMSAPDHQLRFRLVERKETPEATPPPEATKPRGRRPRSAQS